MFSVSLTVTLYFNLNTGRWSFTHNHILWLYIQLWKQLRDHMNIFQSNNLWVCVDVKSNFWYSFNYWLCLVNIAIPKIGGGHNFSQSCMFTHIDTGITPSVRGLRQHPQSTDLGASILAVTCWAYGQHYTVYYMYSTHPSDLQKPCISSFSIVISCIWHRPIFREDISFLLEQYHLITAMKICCYASVNANIMLMGARENHLFSHSLKTSLEIYCRTVEDIQSALGTSINTHMHIFLCLCDHISVSYVLQHTWHWNMSTPFISSDKMKPSVLGSCGVLFIFLFTYNPASWSPVSSAVMFKVRLHCCKPTCLNLASEPTTICLICFSCQPLRSLTKHAEKLFLSFFLHECLLFSLQKTVAEACKEFPALVRSFS